MPGTVLSARYMVGSKNRVGISNGVYGVVIGEMVVN